MRFSPQQLSVYFTSLHISRCACGMFHPTHLPFHFLSLKTSPQPYVSSKMNAGEKQTPTHIITQSNKRPRLQDCNCILSCTLLWSLILSEVKIRDTSSCIDIALPFNCILTGNLFLHSEAARCCNNTGWYLDKKLMLYGSLLEVS